VKLGISNIAWNREEDDVVVAALRKHGVTALEVAPTKLWDDPFSVKDKDLDSYGQKVADAGIEIVALQSLLYGHPKLCLFDSDDARSEALSHLAKMCRFAAQLGAKVLVFGSPKNRARGTMPIAEALPIATDFFRALGNTAANEGVCVCIEPLPASMGCDFINDVAEAKTLLGNVQSPGFGLHLDASSMHTNCEDYECVIAKSIGLVRHFHISEVGYGPFGSTEVDHPRLGAALRSNHYQHTVSIEMIGNRNDENRVRVLEAVTRAHAVYLGD
jgi:D-psicose/D-tagatose/L-ribulose 3-epimerase